MTALTENDQLSDENDDGTSAEVETGEGTSETSAADTETDDPAAQEPPRWTRYARKIVIAVVVAAVLGGVGMLGWTVWEQRTIARAGHEAQQAAVAYAQVLTSVDSGNVDQNFTDVLNGSTGEFKDMYSKASVELRQLLVDNKASAHGVVVESAVQSATADKAVVLLFVDQSITNTNVPDPRIDRSRIKMTMEKVDDRWRASKVELP